MGVYDIAFKNNGRNDIFKWSLLQFMQIRNNPFFELCISLREKCPYSDFFWSVFSRIRTEYGEYILRNQSKCGKIRTRKTPNTDTFHAIIYLFIYSLFNVDVIYLQ